MSNASHVDTLGGHLLSLFQNQFITITAAATITTAAAAVVAAAATTTATTILNTSLMC